MSTAFQTTLQTMITFFLLLAVGFVAGRVGVVKREFMGSLAQIITKIFLPAMIFYLTISNVTRDMLVSNLFLVPVSIGVYAVLAVVTFIMAKVLRIPHDKDRVFQFAFMFGNTGFVGYPLLSSVFPEVGMLFMCLFSIVDQAAFWTYGVWLSTARGRNAEKFNVRRLISPNIVAIVLSFLYVSLNLPSLPSVLDLAFGALSTATSPLCMLYLGATVCFANVWATLTRSETYVGIGVKMLILPACAGLALCALGVSPDIAGCVALYVALPVMTVVPMVASQNGNEGEYATGLAVATFVACVITIPLVAFVAL